MTDETAIATQDEVAPVTKDMALPRDDEGGGGFDQMPAVLYFGSAAKGETLEACKSAGIELDTFYLKDALGVRRIKPFRIVPTDLYWDGYVKRDSSNKVIATSLDKPADGKFYQCRLAVVVVVDEDDKSVTPAFIQTTGALSRFWDNISTANKAVKAGDGQAWFRRGPKFAATQAAKHPLHRFTAKIWGELTEPKGDGDPYNKGYSLIEPSSPALIEVLNSTFDRTMNLKMADAFDHRVAWLEKMLIKA